MDLCPFMCVMSTRPETSSGGGAVLSSITRYWPVHGFAQTLSSPRVAASSLRNAMKTITRGTIHPTNCIENTSSPSVWDVWVSTRCILFGSIRPLLDDGRHDCVPNSIESTE